MEISIRPIPGFANRNTVSGHRAKFRQTESLQVSYRASTRSPIRYLRWSRKFQCECPVVPVTPGNGVRPGRVNNDS